MNVCTMFRQMLIKSLLLLCSLSSFFMVADSKIILHNKSLMSLWIYVYRPEFYYKNVKEKVTGGDTWIWDGKGEIPSLSMVPFLPDMPIDTFEGLVAQDLGSSKEVEQKLREHAFALNLYIKPIWSNVDLTFGANSQDDKGSLSYTRDLLTMPFSILLTSDLHIGPNGDAMQQKKVTMMQQYIQDSSKNVQGVILNGDLAGQYGKKAELESFKGLVYEPLKNLLAAKGAALYLGIGNHDTYWNQEYKGKLTNIFLPEPYPTATMRFLKNLNGGYMYAFSLGGIRCINLGLYASSSLSGGIEKGESSLDFLKNELSRLKKTDPIILFFHYPMSGLFADWWSKAEKDALYQAIYDYHVLAILVGHAHVSAMYKFRGKIPTIQAAGNQFADIHIDPTKNYELDVSFVDGAGVCVPGSAFVSADTYEPDLKK